MDDEALKRQFSRVPLSHTVRYRAEDTHKFASGDMSNLSLGGMFVQTSQPLAAGTEVYLQFLAESGEIVAEGHARVAHIGDGGMGLEFTSIDEKFIAYAQLVVSEGLIQQRLRT